MIAKICSLVADETFLFARNLSSCCKNICKPASIPGPLRSNLRMPTLLPGAAQHRARKTIAVSLCSVNPNAEFCFAARIVLPCGQMRQLQPVVWSKGTFLTPQHLQTRDRFLESVLQFRLEALSFCPWGFQELQLNREALAGGNFALTRAVGILPDGLPFDVPDSDP